MILRANKTRKHVSEGERGEQRGKEVDFCTGEPMPLKRQKQIDFMASFPDAERAV